MTTTTITPLAIRRAARQRHDMTMTTMLLALIAWLLISCAIAWGIGRASGLGQAEESRKRGAAAPTNADTAF